MAAERGLHVPVAKMSDIEYFLGIRPHSRWHPLLKKTFKHDVELDFDSTVLYPTPHALGVYRVQHPNDGWVNVSPRQGKPAVEHLPVRQWHVSDFQLSSLFSEDQIQHWREKK